MLTESTTIRHFASILLLCAAFATLAAGCGGGGETASPGPDYEATLEGAPPRLASIHAQANELIDAGPNGLDDRIGELRGFPVVVNVWASWCGPCRAEFPHFQNAAGSLGKRVAFLGVDSDDSEEAAATFLRDHPVPYPSYLDPDRSILTSFGGLGGLPVTAFFDRGGEQTYLKQGPYRSEEELIADIRRHALGQESGGSQ